jgi:hypothetical protein
MPTIARALKWGLLGLIFAPVVAAFGGLAVGHLAGACGPGSSGGCEMGAVGLAIYSAIPGFILGAAVSVARDMLARRS